MVLSVAAERFMAGPLLAEVDAEARLALFHALKEDYASKGTILTEEGKPNDRLWFLIDGTAAIIRRESNRDVLIANLSAPGIFGTTSFFLPIVPTVSIRATSNVDLLILDHGSHARLRRDEPRAAEALALATVRVLAERFDLLDLRVTEYIASHANDQRKANEWAKFRAKLFE